MNKNKDEFQALLDQVRESADYDAEVLRQSFADQLWSALSAEQGKQADVARRAGVTRQFLTRVFQGKRNLTLKTIAKLAHAVNLRAHLHLAPSQVDCEWHHFWKEDPRRTLLADHFNVRAAQSYTLTALPPDQREFETPDHVILAGDFDIEETRSYTVSTLAPAKANEEIPAAA
jgi:DNA-binding phage protein